MRLLRAKTRQSGQAWQAMQRTKLPLVSGGAEDGGKEAYNTQGEMWHILGAEARGAGVEAEDTQGKRDE